MKIIERIKTNWERKNVIAAPVEEIKLKSLLSKYKKLEAEKESEEQKTEKQRKERSIEYWEAVFKAIIIPKISEVLEDNQLFYEITLYKDSMQIITCSASDIGCDIPTNYQEKLAFLLDQHQRAECDFKGSNYSRYFTVSYYGDNSFTIRVKSNITCLEF
jgi:hypothetical protein